MHSVGKRGSISLTLILTFLENNTWDKANHSNSHTTSGDHVAVSAKRWQHKKVTHSMDTIWSYRGKDHHMYIHILCINHYTHKLPTDIQLCFMQLLTLSISSFALQQWLHTFGWFFFLKWDQFINDKLTPSIWNTKSRERPGKTCHVQKH